MADISIGKRTAAARAACRRFSRVCRHTGLACLWQLENCSRFAFRAFRTPRVRALDAESLVKDLRGCLKRPCSDWVYVSVFVLRVLSFSFPGGALASG